MPTKYIYLITFHNSDQLIKTKSQNDVVNLINGYYDCPLVTADVIRNIIYNHRCDATRVKFSRLFTIQRHLITDS